MKNSSLIKNQGTGNTEEKIFKQAIRLFLEKGYHGTSIDDITQAAGFTKGALYWHFRRKEDLLRKVIEDFEQGFLNGLLQAVGEMKGGAFKKFDKLCRYNAAFAYHNPELCVSFTTLAAELIGTHHGIETEFKRVYKRYQEFLSNLIIQGKKEKLFKNEIDEDLTALGIMAFHDGILLHWFMHRDDEVDGKGLADTFKKIILYGLMA